MISFIFLLKRVNEIGLFFFKLLLSICQHGSDFFLLLLIGGIVKCSFQIRNLWFSFSDLLLCLINHLLSLTRLLLALGFLFDGVQLRVSIGFCRIVLVVLLIQHMLGIFELGSGGWSLEVLLGLLKGMKGGVEHTFFVGFTLLKLLLFFHRMLQGLFKSLFFSRVDLLCFIIQHILDLFNSFLLPLDLLLGSFKIRDQGLVQGLEVVLLLNLSN